MRTTLALVLVAMTLSSCYTTSRRSLVLESPVPPEADEVLVVGVELAGGEQIRFARPATLSPDGTVAGLVEMPYAGGESALRRVAYAPGDIVAYRVETVDREFSWLRTLAIPVVGFAIGFGVVWILVANQS